MSKLNLLFSLAVFLTIPCILNGQTMADALYNGTQVTWVGLDFSNAKFVPAVEFTEVDADPQLAILKWNNLLEQEPEKFNLCKALESTRCSTNTSFMRKVHEGLTSEELLGRESYSLDKAEIPGMVKDYDTKGEGVGVVFIVSSFDKTQNMAEYWVTFFNMETKEILHTQRLAAKPSGFGMRNYWAGSVYQALKTIQKNHLNTWRTQFR